MKILCAFLSISCGVYAGSVDIRGMCKQAYQMEENWNEDEDKDEYVNREDFLFTTYSETIEALDEETLKENPELVFRREQLRNLSLIYFDTIPDNRFSEYPEAHKDLQFVMEHAQKDSRLFKAAKEHDEILMLIMEGPNETDEKIMQIIHQINETKHLKPWATEPSLSGPALRENVFKNLQSSPESMISFMDYVFLLSSDSDVSLGYIHPKLIGLEVVYKDADEDDDAQCYLMCTFRYSPIENEQWHTSTVEEQF